MNKFLLRVDKWNPVQCLAVLLCMLGLGTLAGFLFQLAGIPETAIVLVYGLAVLFCALCTKGYVYGLICAVLSALCFNFFFTVPYFTFRVDDPAYVPIFFSMATVSAITSLLICLIKEGLVAISRKEAQLQTLYDVVHRLNQATDSAQVKAIENEETDPAIAPAIRENVQLALDRLEAMERQLQETYRANLLRSISHDLRTPLSAILANAGLLEAQTDGENHILAQEIKTDSAHLHALVENILTLTKVQADRLDVKKEAVPAEEILEGTAAVWKDGNTTWNLPEEELTLLCNPVLVQQALLNLLDNARVHGGKDCAISVNLEKRKDETVLSVTDDGISIDQARIPHLFETFYGDGAGLGLSICEAVAKAHGGHMEVTSGKETVFSLVLPGGNDA